MTGAEILLASGLCTVFLSLLVASTALLVVRGERQQVVRSLDAVRYARLSSGLTVAPPASFRQRIIEPFGLRMAKVGRRISPSGTAAKLARRLDLAGNPRNYRVEQVLALKVLGLVSVPLIALALSPSNFLIISLPLAAFAGFMLPDLLLQNTGIKRQLLLQRTLPDALDLLTISVEAGLGFDAALSQVARNTKGPLAGELFRVLQEMQIGKSRTAAFEALADRTDVPELSRFVSSMVQADSLGIPVGRVLREQAGEMRLKRSQRAEEQAHKVPVKILFPMVAFLLPAIFVIIIGPGALTIMKTIG